MKSLAEWDNILKDNDEETSDKKEESNVLKTIRDIESANEILHTTPDDVMEITDSS